MAVICPQCKTKNRSVAKFCIECIGALPTAFASADTALSPLASRAAQPSSKGLWISVAAFSIALTVGAGGWLVAGAGGWYFYAAGNTQVHPARADAPAEAEAPAGRVLAPVAVPVLVPASAPLPAPEIEQRTPIAVQTKAPKVSDPPRAAPETSRPKPAPSPSPRAAATALGPPGNACSGMNFVAAARCMAAQCLKPEFKAHAQCEAVRRQQLIEEQKRNPVAP